MKINRFLFNNKDYVFESDFDFSNEHFDENHIRSVSNVHAKITGQIFGDLLMLKVQVKAHVVGVCAYTLEDVPLDLNIKENIEISDEVEDDDVIFYEKNPIFDIDPYILSLIVSNVPTKLVKEGAKLPESGEGYRVISEDEYRKEQQNKKDSRWDILDTIDLDK